MPFKIYKLRNPTLHHGVPHTGLLGGVSLLYRYDFDVIIKPNLHEEDGEYEEMIEFFNNSKYRPMRIGQTTHVLSIGMNTVADIPAHVFDIVLPFRFDDSPDLPVFGPPIPQFVLPNMDNDSD